MAVAHISYNRETQYGRMIASAMTQIDEGRTGLIDLLGILAKMIDGDPSVAANYSYMVTKCGFTDNAGAMAGYNELNSLMLKLTSNASQIDVANAITQACAKLG